MAHAKKVAFTRLIIGLGNPGNQYVHTRHNTGAGFVRSLASQLNVVLSAEPKLKAVIGVTQLQYSGLNRVEEWILAIPDVYMNQSGESVRSIMKTFGLNRSDQLCVAFDCIDHSVGRVALSFDGSARGHNGLRSIDQHLKTLSFWRIRFGIGRPESKTKNRFAISRYVLGEWPENEQEIIQKCYKDAAMKLLSGDQKFAFTEVRLEGE